MHKITEEKKKNKCKIINLGITAHSEIKEEESLVKARAKSQASKKKKTTTINLVISPMKKLNFPKKKIFKLLKVLTV